MILNCREQTKRDIRFQSVKFETQSFDSKKQKEHVYAPVCFEPSMYLEAAEVAVFEKEKYFENKNIAGIHAR